LATDKKSDKSGTDSTKKSDKVADGANKKAADKTPADAAKKSESKIVAPNTPATVADEISGAGDQAGEPETPKSAAGSKRSAARSTPSNSAKRRKH
jgi:hypothetical protein